MTAIISGNGKIVTIGNTTFERIIAKQVNVINLPKSSIKWGEGANPSKMIDLLRVDKRINMDGYLVNDLGDNDTSTTAVGKRDDLIYMIRYGGVLALVHKSTTASIQIDKIQFNEESEDESGDPSRITVKLTAIEGVNL